MPAGEERSPCSALDSHEKDSALLTCTHRLTCLDLTVYTPDEPALIGLNSAEAAFFSRPRLPFSRGLTTCSFRGMQTLGDMNLLLVLDPRAQ